MRNLILGSFFLMLLTPVWAQIDNRFISDNLQMSTIDSSSYGLHMQAMPYMRNTEYFNDIELGRTLFGYQLHPSLYLKPNARMNLQFGVFARHDFGGNNPYTKLLPTFTLQLQTKNQMQFIFGTLNGALSHRLIEPLFDINAAIERRIENGFQFRKESEKGFYDAWINWEQFIERGDPFKERFTAGFNLTPRLFEAEKRTGIYLSSQFTAHHKGGQIDSDTGNMEMVLNGALGLVAKKQFTGTLRFFEASIYGTGFAEQTNSGNYAYKQGSGIFANLSLGISDITCMLSYWQASQFISPRGTAIYQSVSVDKPGLRMASRELLFLRLLYQKQIYPNLYLDARAEPVLDVKNSVFDYSYSLYITYRQHFGLGKIKR